MSEEPQNIYDDPAFHAGYSGLPRAQYGLSEVYEWGAFQRLLPANIAGMRVLDLGCGFGFYAREMRLRGASSVLAIDLSERMLARARAENGDPAITYLRADIATFAPQENAFDLVISALALHYIRDYAGVVRRIAATLAPGGRLAFSVEHPIVTASGNGMGAWHTAPDGTKLHWPVDHYREEGERRQRWFVDGVMKYHRTMETYVNTIIDAGLRLTRIEEPEGDAALMARHPEWLDERRRPPFLLIAADRL